MSSGKSHLMAGIGGLRRLAIGILLVLDGLASLGGAVGQVGTVIPESLAFVGTAAVAVAVGSVVSPWVRRSIGGASVSGGSTATQDWNRVHKATTPLELYQAEGCPYCRKVRKFCTRSGISVVLHNPRTAGTMVTSGRVTNRETYEDLTEYGRDQVPLLVDTEREEAIYESDEIVDYLRAHYA